MANTQINISENGTTTLATSGKYCDRNIDVNVEVPSTELPTSFTNVLKHSSTTVSLNKYVTLASEGTATGEIAIIIDLVGLGITTHPTTLNFRWRGMDFGSNTDIFVSTDKTSWTRWDYSYKATWDEHGDRIFTKSINYPTSNRYLKMGFNLKNNKISPTTITQSDVDNCILTINEPIGNGGYVG